MKLLIYEYVTAGGMGRADGQALLAEADAMLQALVRDFRIVPDIEVHVLRCPSLATLPSEARDEGLAGPSTEGSVQIHSSAGSEDLARVLDRCDAAVLVAPETDGILHALTRQVESAGVALLSCHSTSIACAGDKWLTAEALDRAGIAQIPTFPVSRNWPVIKGPWVLKPRTGCGCTGVQRFADQDAAHRYAHISSGDQVAQPWLDGAALSLSVLASPRGAELLSVNRQQLNLHADGLVELRTVETGALEDREGAFASLARAVHDAIPGLRGIFGIDLLVQNDRALVVEVNPRVTSAYPGLGAAIGVNPAEVWLERLGIDASGCDGSESAALDGGALAPTEASSPAARQRQSPEGPTLGWDMGGAHLKVAALSAQGQLLEVIQRPCALWQGLDRLVPLLAELITRWGTPKHHAVTMSGEMVDLFRDRQTGVRALLEIFSGQANGVPVQVYVGGALPFLPAEACSGAELRIASANWLSTGDWVARHVPRGIVLDIGSTTTDLLCFAHGQAQAEAQGDAARLASDELVYTGVARTPLMALAQRVPLAGRSRGVIAELFATSADLYRVLGTLPEEADQHPSADGGPKTVSASVTRLARMVGCDGPEHAFSVWQSLAAVFRDRQLHLIADALARAKLRLEGVSPSGGAVDSKAPVLVLAGVGRFLAEDLARQKGYRTRDFSSIGGLIEADAPYAGALAEQASRCAPAVAVAALAALVHRR